MKTTLLAAGVGCLALAGVTVVHAQGGPPPLGPPPIPAGNPQSAAKIQLGTALFWEEQLSLTGTVACGTCHRPFGGGGDPRTALAGTDSTNPGRDGVLGTGDDLHASAGVPAHGADGLYQSVAPFGMAGGQPGERGRNWVERADGRVEEMGHIGSVEMEPGDVYVIQTPGGGGFGSP